MTNILQKLGFSTLLLILFQILFVPSLWAKVPVAPQCLPEPNNLAEIRGLATALECRNIQKSELCQELYRSLKDEGETVSDYALGCSAQELKQDEELMLLSGQKLWGCAIGAGQGIIGRLGTSIGESLAKIVTDFEIDSECNKSIENKKRLYLVHNGSVPKSLQQAIPKDSVLAAHSCDDLQRSIYNENRYKILKTARENGQKVNLKSEINILAAAKAQLKNLGVRIDCYNPVQRARLLCEAVATVGTVVIPLANLNKIKALAGLDELTASAKIVDSAKAKSFIELVAEGNKVKVLNSAEKLSDAERVAAAQDLLGVTFTDKQATALIRAHNEVGAGRGYFTYTKEDIRDKARILKEAGFSPEERRALMETGLAGNSDDYVRASLRAEVEEGKAYAKYAELESQRIVVDAKLANTNLTAAERELFLKNRETIESGLKEARGKIFVDDVGPGLGPMNLEFLERQIGLRERQLLVAKETGAQTGAVYLGLAKGHKELGELQGATRLYKDAQAAFVKASEDLSQVVKQGVEQPYLAKTEAARTIQMSGKASSNEAYSDVLHDILREPIMKRIDIETMTFGYGSISPAVLNAQKGKVWEAYREYREQSVRVDLMRTKNEVDVGSSWEKNKRLNVQFDRMIERREKLEQELRSRIIQEIKANRGNVNLAEKEFQQLITN